MGQPVNNVFLYFIYSITLFVLNQTSTKILQRFKILCHRSWLFIFFLFPVKFNYLEIYFISKPRNSIPNKKVKKHYFLVTKPDLTPSRFSYSYTCAIVTKLGKSTQKYKKLRTTQGF